MGTDYYAYAVIGCEVTGKLYDETGVRRCDCPIGPGRFCAHCGKSTALEVRHTPKTFYDENAHTIGILTVSFTTDYKRAFAGIRTKVSSEGVYSEKKGYADLRPIPNPADFFNVVKAELEKFDLWDPSSFGLWAVLHCSY